MNTLTLQRLQPQTEAEPWAATMAQLRKGHKYPSIWIVSKPRRGPDAERWMPAHSFVADGFQLSAHGQSVQTLGFSRCGRVLARRQVTALVGAFTAVGKAHPELAVAEIGLDGPIAMFVVVPEVLRLGQKPRADSNRASRVHAVSLRLSSLAQIR